MKTLNNTQRTGLVRMLEAVKKDLENKNDYSERLYFRENTDEEDMEGWNEKAREMVLRMTKKTHFYELVKLKDETEKRINEIEKEIQKSLEIFTVDNRKTKAETLKSVKLAIRDLWTEPDAEKAKELVAKFIIK